MSCVGPRRSSHSITDMHMETWDSRSFYYQSMVSQLVPSFFETLPVEVSSMLPSFNATLTRCCPSSLLPSLTAALAAALAATLGAPLGQLAAALAAALGLTAALTSLVLPSLLSC